ncbi:alpha/beta fold hydrolase (macronuclear) [Tetrahymena thermophila SB210]|uniref:Alpha/beta fold hydrolase n=1 Tax=Tetrahymena thermophila (strain SB210) TaxID=312017 RepID=Q23FZ1_TETTS|nr:alpha/beta fold hydrolase [Tetrahymena thermophila SB210]EAR95469.2 alpha/beta fold hydrolase [Tetrahymena thermophila SB210]|eukprot:XP_001015714.2 alpha/beta fold hydrolase [Tetrahymena thermophila SB210]
MHLFFNDKEIENKLAFIFKPKKYCYSVSELGYGKLNLDEMISPRMMFQHQQVERTDFQVQNLRKEKLQCSIYSNNLVQSKSVAVVYLHGNAGTRLDSVPAVKHIVSKLGVDLCSFDFSGCGRSEGDFVTLGIKEQDDLQVVLETLVSKYNYQKFILYGRSMGGVTSLLYSANRPFAQKHVIAIIVDSPFCSLKQLATEIADDKMAFLGGFIAEMSFEYIRELVKKMTHGSDIFSLEVDKQVSRCTQFPALFCYSHEDKLIKYTHSEKLISKYGGKSSSFIFSGDHNAFRDENYFDNIINFIKDILASNKIMITFNQKLETSTTTPKSSSSAATSALYKFPISVSQSTNSIKPMHLQKNHLAEKSHTFEQTYNKGHHITTLNEGSSPISNNKNQQHNNISINQLKHRNIFNLSTNHTGQSEGQNQVQSKHHQNNLHKQQSLPVQLNPAAGQPDKQDHQIKKQTSFIQARAPSEFATRISLCNQNNRELLSAKVIQESTTTTTPPQQKQNNDQAEKQASFTPITGIRKIPSQPIIFPLEMNENKRISLIDNSYSQRQVSQSNHNNEQLVLKNYLHRRETLAASQLQQQNQLPQQNKQPVIFVETENEEKRRQSIFHKINSLQISKSQLNSPQIQISIQPNEQLNMQKQNSQNRQKSKDNSSGLNDLHSNRANEAYYINLNHRQSLVSNQLPLQNTTNINYNLSQQTMKSSSNLQQEASKSINSQSSQFISPRPMHSHNQQHTMQINLYFSLILFIIFKYFVYFKLEELIKKQQQLTFNKATIW